MRRHMVMPEKLGCEDIDGKTEHDRPSVNRFIQRSSAAGKRMMEHDCGHPGL